MTTATTDLVEFVSAYIKSDPKEWLHQTQL